MKHKNIAIFIPQLGCPNSCSFCNQNVISSTVTPPTVFEVEETLIQAFEEIGDKSTTEIAFFGGSFTAIPYDYMIDLLTVANKYITCENGFIGIRISTRPDKIDENILDILKKYNVTSIELGAQSMVDNVLDANNRGHIKDDIVNASNLIKSYGFELGLQMMVGLYKSSYDDEIFTAEQIISLKPKTVRIYPTVVLEGTYLADLYKQGKYEIISLDDAVKICSKLLYLFYENNINVIKLGLHSSTDVENSMVTGIYHEAFRELCEGEIYYNLIEDILFNGNSLNLANEQVVYVAKSCVSKAIGQKKCNILKLQSKGINIKIKVDEKLDIFQIKI